MKEMNNFQVNNKKGRNKLCQPTTLVNKRNELIKFKESFRFILFLFWCCFFRNKTLSKSCKLKVLFFYYNNI